MNPSSPSNTSWQRSIENSGFAIIPDVMSANEIAVLIDGLSHLGHRPGRAGIRHILSHLAVQAIANDRRLLEIAQTVLGKNALPFRATLFDKSPQSNWLIAWHQDTALPLTEKRETPGWGPWSVKEGIDYAHAPASALEQVLALRLHLDDSTQETGPLRVLPATHKMGVLSDHAVQQRAREGRPVDCLIGKGGVVAMRPMLIHASSKSTSRLSRRVLHLEYAARRSFDAALLLALA